MTITTARPLAKTADKPIPLIVERPTMMANPKRESAQSAAPPTAAAARITTSG